MAASLEHLGLILYIESPKLLSTFLRTASKSDGVLSKLTGEHSMGDWMQKAYCVLSFMEAHRCARDELPRFFHDDDAKALQNS